MFKKSPKNQNQKFKLKEELKKLKSRKQVFKKIQKEKDIKDLLEKYDKKNPNPLSLKLKHYFYGLRKEYVRIGWLKKAEVIRDFYQVVGFSLFFLSIFLIVDILMSIFRWTGLM
ncbi:preprotein translocase subunit SecE [Mycoplasma sp. SG1]|uniref:preprotein translocase subunit SecE n=1 Tax=Mycoplasma sp. SG1 TaxID=2810348 RepID=UPI002024319C|nr:preprotein translocase subunit SecE [Mycoplasma sp. SG1]URM52877.1 preprotein translocase subunit SecE [Mycoplasma sp. SG1]